MAERDFIEHIFQRATEEFDIEFNPVAWERMEKKLNQARRRRKLLFWLQWAGLLLLAIFIGWLFWRQNLVANSKPIEPIVAIPTPLLEEPCVEICYFYQSEKRQNTPIRANEALPVQQPRSFLATQNTHRDFFGNLREGNKDRHAAIALQHKTFENNLDSNYLNINNIYKLSNPNIVSVFTHRDIIASPLLKSQTSEEPLILLSQQLIVETEVKPSDPFWNRWTVGVFAAPEAVSVGLDAPTQSGYCLGVLTEYRFQKRFSLSVQGSYSKKRYTAGAGEFNPPRGSWLNGIAPLETLGACKMLEATVGLRAELLQKTHWNLVANAGVSSWWMQSEWYDYDFPDPTPDRSWRSNGSSSFLWAMGMVSVGAEWKLTKKLSVQGELYSQIPLKGVGRGKIELYSQGIAVSLRHRF